MWLIIGLTIAIVAGVLIDQLTTSSSYLNNWLRKRG
jgi:hypothetical protein